MPFFRTFLAGVAIVLVSHCSSHTTATTTTTSSSELSTDSTTATASDVALVPGAGDGPAADDEVTVTSTRKPRYWQEKAERDKQSARRRAANSETKLPEVEKTTTKRPVGFSNNITLLLLQLCIYYTFIVCFLLLIKLTSTFHDSKFEIPVTIR
jgi:hypothetical protein